MSLVRALPGLDATAPLVPWSPPKKWSEEELFGVEYILRPSLLFLQARDGGWVGSSDLDIIQGVLRTAGVSDLSETAGTALFFDPHFGYKRTILTRWKDALQSLGLW